MIREFYQDRTVLLTGGTGFYGQGLTAKILRYLPGVRRLYLVLRPGRGPGGAALPVEERLDELFKLVVFDRFRREEPAAFAAVRQKVRALACDMRQPGLGLDDASRDELLAEVDLIIGNAASVTFDEPLDSAIQFNTLAPQELLRLAREGRKKPVLVHVSTAYVNGRLTGTIPEQTLPINRTIQHLIDGNTPPQPFVPEEEIAQAQARCRAIRAQAQSAEQQQAFRHEIVEQSHSRKLSDSRLQKLVDDRCRRWIERELVEEGMRRARQHGWNDVYTFTKAMGEQLLVKHRDQVPLAIVRPSVTEGALEDPHPGWIHGLKVTDPLIVAYGRGIVPDFPAAGGAPMDLVPVDIVVNTVLAAATQATASKVEVFHAATSEENPLPNTRMFKYVKGYFEEHPLLNKDGSRPELVDWTFPTVARFQRAFNWKYLYPLEIKQKLYEYLPERWAPAQKKRRLAALKTRLKRVQYFTDLFSPYTTLDCRYETKRMLALYESLSPEEQRIFNMDVRRIDWYQYYQRTHLPGLRRHELGGTDDDREPLSAAPSEVGGEEQRWRIEESIRTIPDLLRWACGRYAARTALQIERRAGWTRISYDELLTRAECMARSWQAQGVSADARVLLCGDNGPEWVIAYMAASLLGLAVVPIDPQTREEDIWALCDFVQARALIAAEKRFSLLSPEGVAAHKEMAFFNVDRDGLPFGHAPEPAAAGGASRWKSPRVGPDATASILFTSVIEPRGVVLSHRNLICNVLAQGEVLGIYESDRMLSTLPLHQVLEFTGGLLLPLLSGATITYLEAVNSREMLRALHDTGTTMLLTAPRLLRVLADRVERLGAEATEATAALAALRRVVSVGATLSDDLLDAYERLGVAICQGYGLSEAASIVAVNVPKQGKARSVGQVLPGQQVQIAEPDERGVGEVLVRGANVMEGYLSQEELTQAVLRDGWLHTGDLGRLDDGYLFVEGRSKDLIVNGAGHNVYPREIESLYHGLAARGRADRGRRALGSHRGRRSARRGRNQPRLRGSRSPARGHPSALIRDFAHLAQPSPDPAPALLDPTAAKAGRRHRRPPNPVDRNRARRLPRHGPAAMGAGDPAPNRPARWSERRGGSSSHRRAARHLVGFADGSGVRRVARPAAGGPSRWTFAATGHAPQRLGAAGDSLARRGGLGGGAVAGVLVGHLAGRAECRARERGRQKDAARIPVGGRRPLVPPLFRPPGRRPRALATRSALPDCRQPRQPPRRCLRVLSRALPCRSPQYRNQRALPCRLRVALVFVHLCQRRPLRRPRRFCRRLGAGAAIGGGAPPAAGLSRRHALSQRSATAV